MATNNLNLLKKLIISTFYPLIKPLIYSLKSGGKSVKVIIFYKDKLLLIKNSYREGWTFPGGGIKKDESATAAAKREVYEEVGLVTDKLIDKGSLILDFDGKGSISMFSCCINSPNIKIDNLEVEKAVWINANDLSKYSLLPVAIRCAKSLKLIN